MRKTKYLFSVLIFFVITACTTNRTLLHKYSSGYGEIDFFVERIKKKGAIKRVYAKIFLENETAYYIFYPDKIEKISSKEKQTVFVLRNNILLNNYDSTIYKKVSDLDAFIFSKGDMLLDSLKFNTLKRSSSASYYEIEINYNHGYPSHSKFRLKGK